MASMIRTVHVRIRGRVQGVYFRAWTRNQAISLGLDGWVRNCTDGSVEAVVSGPVSAVAGMLTAFHAGPPDAVVEAVEIVQDGGSVPEGFEIRPSSG